jgi:Skp family chaperone for outer membrane proteins
MKTLSSFAKFAAFAGALALSGAAQAQVNGIATADPATAIAASQARSTAYQQINTQYQASLTTINTLQQEVQSLSQQLDANSDGNVTDAEIQSAQQANNPIIGQIQSKQTQINTALQPLVRAQVYALEQILQDYNNAQLQVISDKKIGMILSPDAFVYVPPEADVTQAITTVINTRLPSVQIAPPANYQPSQQGQQLYERVRQVLLLNAAIQRQRAAQQQQGAATPPAPTGR